MLGHCRRSHTAKNRQAIVDGRRLISFANHWPVRSEAPKEESYCGRRLIVEETEMVEADAGNAHFFSRSGPHSLKVVAEVACGTARECNLLLRGVAPLQTA